MKSLALISRRPGRLATARRAGLLVAAFAVVGVTPVRLAAQPATGAQPSRPAGLDALPEDRLLAELAARRINSLFDVALANSGLTPEQKSTLQSLLALRTLDDGAAPADARRDELVARAVGALQKSLPTQTDPRLLLDTARLLTRHGISRDLSLLEYWGSDIATPATAVSDRPVGQAPASAGTGGGGGDTQRAARVRPVAVAVSRALARASDIARTQADQLANAMTADADAATVDRYTALDLLASTAEYEKAIADYAVVLSADPADPSRQPLARETAKFLTRFDTPDSGVQAAVRICRGKLLLVAGDYAESLRLLDSVVPATPPSTAPDNAAPLAALPQVAPATPVPPPTPEQQFEALWFAALGVLRSGDATSAAVRAERVEAFISGGLAGSPSRRGAEAAAAMLRYRILSAGGDVAGARAVLVRLLAERPELESVVFDQLLAGTSATTDVKALDPLTLRALVRRGEQESAMSTATSRPADTAAVSLAVRAARELLSRPASGGSDRSRPELQRVALQLALLLEHQGQRLDALRTLLDYVQAFGQTSADATAALDEAAYLLTELRRQSPNDLAVGREYDRFLAFAVEPPFSRGELAYDRARRLQLAGRYTEALRYFDRVPASDPRQPLTRFFKLVALKQVLDDPNQRFSPDQRRGRADDILSLAQRVLATSRDRLAAPALSPEDARSERVIIARTSLVAADVALRELKDPARALALLDPLSEAAGGEAPAAQGDLLAQATDLRVRALMDQGRNELAAQTLVPLLQKSGGTEGADLVFRLLTRLTDDFDAASAAGDLATARTKARSRAQLSGFLVRWADGNTDPRIRTLAPRYRIFDADTQRLAATLEPDPAARDRQLRDTLELYRGLRTPPSSTPRGGGGGNATATQDPAADLGFALTSYDLRDYATARDLLASLLADRKLGRPTLEDDRDGQPVVVSNDRYWEATLKLMRATIKLVEAGQAPPDARTQTIDGLKVLFARWGAALGGPRWAPEFEKLRREIAPDYAVPELSGEPGGS